MSRKISIVGMGMDGKDTLTAEGLETVKNADILIGAGRMTDMLSYLSKPCMDIYMPKDIAELINGCGYENIAVLMSGDCGFYSGARGLLEYFPDADIIPGISSPVYFAARLKKQWSGFKMISLHGSDTPLVRHVRSNRQVFALLGKENQAAGVCARLCEYHMPDVRVFVGERLGSSEENITEGSAEELCALKTSPLSVILIENDRYEKYVPSGIPDSEFIRSGVPMTKSDIRAAVISRLKIPSDGICWDAGSGTGSVSVEMAMRCPDGMVYAAEKDTEAAGLSQNNFRKFGCDNISLSLGDAADIMKDFPPPDCVFIGGSGGRLSEIIRIADAKNPNAVTVVTAVSLETVSECLNMGEWDITQLSVTKTRRLGSHTMLCGENPVYILERIRCGG